jgi:hypothetical protein
VQQAQDPVVKACYMAELGCYWARTGEFDMAEELRSQLRRGFGDGRNIRVSILIMCLEALLAYFRELSPGARDRMARAALLSTAAQDPSLIALTSAWMAHIDFNLNRFDSMAVSIKSCLSKITPNDGSVDCRISLVLGDAFLFSGLISSSNTWYQRARAAAANIGDQAAIGALTYNRAALHVAAARLKHITNPLPSSDIALVQVEVQSAINYQAIAQLRSLDHLLQSAHVGVMVLLSQWAEALPVITKVLESSEIPENAAERTLLETDLALSLASLAESSRATEIIAGLQKSVIRTFSPDDRALIWHSALRASEVCGLSGELSYYRSEIGSALREHRDIIQNLSSLLHPFEEGLALK